MRASISIDGNAEGPIETKNLSSEPPSQQSTGSRFLFLTREPGFISCPTRTPLAFFASLATFFADDVSGNRMRLLRHYAPAPVCCAVFRAGHAR